MPNYFDQFNNGENNSRLATKSKLFLKFKMKRDQDYNQLKFYNKYIYPNVLNHQQILTLPSLKLQNFPGTFVRKCTNH